MNPKTSYLILAVVGAVIPMYFFVQYSLAEGLSLLPLIAALFGNGASGAFTSDLLISSVVFWIYLFAQPAPAPKPWLFIVLNLFVGLSCALPAYLWAREK